LWLFINSTHEILFKTEHSYFFQQSFTQCLTCDIVPYFPKKHSSKKMHTILFKLLLNSNVRPWQSCNNCYSFNPAVTSSVRLNHAYVRKRVRKRVPLRFRIIFIKLFVMTLCAQCSHRQSKTPFVKYRKPTRNITDPAPILL